MRILAIETSCDETAAAVVEDGQHVLSSEVASQVELHARFGGVFPELASRQHVLAIDPVVTRALADAGIEEPADLDAVAVTCGPGLVGSLMVGVNAAKGFCLGTGLPLIGVNHLVGHLYSLWLETDRAVGCDWRDLAFPHLSLIVSGGHTELILMHGHGSWKRLGGTLDDAAGEAFDKVARILGLGMPGGPAIQQAASEGNPAAHDLPYPLRRDPKHALDFSFSGLKTDMLHRCRRAGLDPDGNTDGVPPEVVNDLAAAFQGRVVELLLDRLETAAVRHSAASIGICGGVSANALLREQAQTRFVGLGLSMRIPPLAWCTDNAAMIGAAAWFGRPTRFEPDHGLSLDVAARLPVA